MAELPPPGRKIDARRDLRSGSARGAARTVRLPRFLVSERVGLGDVVTRMTTAVGAQPCSGCEQRAARMNRWLSFKPHDDPGGMA